MNNFTIFKRFHIYKQCKIDLIFLHLESCSSQNRAVTLKVNITICSIDF